MTTPWTIRLPTAQGGLLSRLFHLPGLRVCEVADSVWVRGDTLDEASDLTLRGIAVADFFWIEPDGEQLRERAARVPTSRLPQANWQPLRQLFQPQRPASVWPGELSESVPRVGLELLPSLDVTEPNVLLTTRTAWTEYAVTAPQVRLDRWRFALASDDRALIRGQPLPPLLGERFVECDGVAVLAGWAWTPAVDVVVVRDLFGLGPNDVALWWPNNCSHTRQSAGVDANDVCETVRGEQFVAATRSNVRACQEVSSDPRDDE
ncbi:MAG: hypothetical protein ACKV2Q_34795 [Planctomycetaceae bacterium]